MAAKFSHKIKSHSVSIYINDILFVLFKRDQFIGVTSWLSDHSDAKFRVSIKLKDGTIELTLSSRERFTGVLRELELAIDDILN